MSDYMRCRHAVFIHKVTCKLCRCLYCCVLKIPIFICCAHALCVFLPYAHFNTDTISVSALCVLIARRSAMPRYISVLYTLPYLAVKSYKVMRRRISIAAAIISAVVLCATQCAYIMDNNILNSGNAALIEIVLTYLSVNVHISRLSAYKKAPAVSRKRFLLLYPYYSYLSCVLCSSTLPVVLSPSSSSVSGSSSVYFARNSRTFSHTFFTGSPHNAIFLKILTTS